MYAKQTVIMPRLHGDGPTNLAAVINRPQAPTARPSAPISFRDLINRKKEEKEDEDEE